MILNTKIILESICVKEDSDIKNPLKIKQELQEQLALEKEQKLQEQVALIFKDPYYKNFQESALSQAPQQAQPEQKTPEQLQREKEEAEAKAEKERLFALKRQFVGSLGGSTGYALGNGVLNLGMQGLTKGATAAYHGIKHLIS